MNDERRAGSSWRSRGPRHRPQRADDHTARAADSLPNVRFELGDVLDLHQPAGFDVISSRFGVMFFADPAAAFAHLRTLGRSRARLGFCCWGPPADNAWMSLPVMATIPIVGPGLPNTTTATRKVTGMTTPPTLKLAPKSFSDVDASGQADAHAAYLERVAARVAGDRERWLEGLDLTPGAVVLDVGSGMGELTRLLSARVGGAGRAEGIDLSVELVDRATEAAAGIDNVAYRVGDATSLPFDDGTFDAAYSERVFIHLADPAVAMGELWRVLRPGGRLVVVDPDHLRTATDADDVELADLLVARLGREFANPGSGRHLRSHAVRAGFTDVRVDGEVRIITDRDEQRRISLRPVEDRLATLVDDGIVTQTRADAYLADQDRRAAEGRFQVTIVVYVLTATKPSATLIGAP